MKVNIKALNIPLNLGSKGTEFEINGTDGKQIGDLFVTNTKIIWCQGKTSKEKGKALTWAQFIALMQNDEPTPPQKRGRKKKEPIPPAP